MTPPAKWQAHFAISHLNTMAAPSIAQYYVEANTEEALVETVRVAGAERVSVNILAGGSNLLCPTIVEGLVLRPTMSGIAASVEQDSQQVILTISAGENWHDLVRWSIANGYYGIENLALIPGTVGAAPVQNIGAYGVELSDVLQSVKWLDLGTQSFHRFSRQECQLGYRDSIFKRELSGRAVITEVVLRLNLQSKPNISYKPLAEYFAQSDQAVTSQSVFEAVCRERQSKLPDPKKVPNSGSFFKNPVIAQKQFKEIKVRNPEMPCYPQPGGVVKVPAAWLIDKCGFKGKQVCGLVVHAKQALVLTNPNACDLPAILAASDKIAKSVFETFGIALEREPQILGVHR